MLARPRILWPLLILAAALVAPAAVRAADPCPAPACITISGTVRGPVFEAVSGYRVLVQRADGYNVTVVTDASGAYSATVPLPSSSSQCYQIVGQADAFYANAATGAKRCSTGRVDLSPKVRIQGTLGEQKMYLPDASAPVALPVEVSALSRTYPAAFEGAPLPWVFKHSDPYQEASGGGYEHGHDGERGVFDAPSVRKIADEVWQYRWTRTIHLDHGAGFYEMDWGRGASMFDPMMECKMIWFGYGIDSLAPSSAVPGQTVTIMGRKFGSTPGALVLAGSGQVTTISGSSIVSWSKTEITFVVPPLAKTGWISVLPPTNLPTNAAYLNLDPVRIRLP